MPGIGSQETWPSPCSRGCGTHGLSRSSVPIPVKAQKRTMVSYEMKPLKWVAGGPPAHRHPPLPEYFWMADDNITDSVLQISFFVNLHPPRPLRHTLPKESPRTFYKMVFSPNHVPRKQALQFLIC